MLFCQQLSRCNNKLLPPACSLKAGQIVDSLHKRLKQYIADDIRLIYELGFDRLDQQDARNASLLFEVMDGHCSKGTKHATTKIDF